METITAKQYNELSHARRKRNKYGAKKTPYKGDLYDSQLEASYAAELDRQLKSGAIKHIERQPHFDILSSGETLWGMKYRKVVYTPDFLIERPDGTTEAVEVKGKETRDYLVRKKLFYAAYPQIPLRVITYTKNDGWIGLDALKAIRRKRRKAKKIISG